MMARKLLPLVLLTALAACGGDDNGDDDVTGPDAAAGPDGGGADAAGGGACAELAAPAGTLSQYPATFDGDVVGAGADLHVATGICTDELSFFDAVGDDQVVALTGMTAGQTYVVTVTSVADLSFYVATGCTEAVDGPAAGQCLLFVDATSVGESGDFVAPEGGNAFVIIDTSATDPVADGTYTLDVRATECTISDDCNADRPICVDFFCVECASDFDCTDPALPQCDGTGVCVAGSSACVNDDAGEDGDDGPAGARPLALSPDTVTSIDAAVCSSPPTEGDYYLVTVGAGELSQIGLEWVSPDADLDMFLFDDTGSIIDASAGFGGGPEALRLEDLAAGDYYVQVVQFSPEDDTAVTAYTLSRAVPVCSTSFDCDSAEAPVCDSIGQCAAGPAACVDDDGGEAAGDDGPAGARPLDAALGAGASLTGSVCSAPSSESDFYSSTVADGDNLTVTLDWESDTADLDLYVISNDGKSDMGFTFWSQPEVVTLTNLPAGTYYIDVVAFSDTPDTASTAYTVSVARSAGGCATSADCDDEFDTQVYRGSCAESGACEHIAGAGALAQGESCDADADCESGFCSYIIFGSNASKAVCSLECSADADCVGALGEGYACTLPFFTNFCTPACEADTDCGANPGSPDLDADLPWDYLTCTDTGGCDI